MADIALGKARLERETAALIVDQFINHADQLTDAAGNRLGTPQFLEVVDLNADGHDDVRISYSSGYQVLLTNTTLAKTAAESAAKFGGTLDSNFLNAKIKALMGGESDHEKGGEIGQYLNPKKGHVSVLNFDSASSTSTEIVVGRARQYKDVVALLQGPNGSQYYQAKATVLDANGLGDAAVEQLGGLLGDPVRDNAGNLVRPYPVDIYADGVYKPDLPIPMGEIELRDSKATPYEDLNGDGRIEQTVLMPDGHKRFVLQYDRAVTIAAQHVAKAQQDVVNAQTAYDQNPRGRGAWQTLQDAKQTLQTHLGEMANLRQLGLWALAAAQRKPTEPADLNNNGLTEKVVAVDLTTASAKRVNVQAFIALPLIEWPQETLDLLLENLTQIVIEEEPIKRP